MSKYKYEIISALMEEQDYISGQSIAEKLNISRTAVWKSIELLRKEGFDIDSVSNRGYLLKCLPDVWDAQLMKGILKPSNYFQEIIALKETASTQIEAQQHLIHHKAPFIVISEIQTAGRGRFNRHWDSQGEKGLWMSLVFNPEIPLRKMTTFNLFIALSIVETMTAFQVDARIKWPNDIYIGERKVCGFLTELYGDAQRASHIICGIGINLNHDKDDFKGELQTKATSLKIESGQHINRYLFFEELIGRIESYYQRFLHEDFSAIKAQYKAHSNIWNRTLRYKEGSRQVTGRAVEINDDGTLIVEDMDGQRHQFISADIEM